MGKLVAATALLILIAGPAAIAQTGGGGGAGSPGGTANPSAKRLPLPAPVGHRQPHADEVPSEKNLSNPNDPENREDAELDKKIKSICRGC
jgi:hypothetical protein